MPNGTTGTPGQGHAMSAGNSFGESDSTFNIRNGAYTALVSKDAISLVASTSGQIVEVYEVSAGGS